MPGANNGNLFHSGYKFGRESIKFGICYELQVTIVTRYEWYYTVAVQKVKNMNRKERKGFSQRTQSFEFAFFFFAYFAKNLCAFAVKTLFEQPLLPAKRQSVLLLCVSDCSGTPQPA
jgi:hypothetical protein